MNFKTVDDAEYFERTLTALYAAFQGTGFTVRITKQSGLYTITCGSLEATRSAQDFAEDGIWMNVSEIVEGWNAR